MDENSPLITEIYVAMMRLTRPISDEADYHSILGDVICSILVKMLITIRRTESQAHYFRVVRLQMIIDGRNELLRV